MLENIKLVIFDLDGVIADTEPLHFFAKSMILQNLGLNNKIDINAFIGKPNQEFWELALRGSEISISYEDLETRQYDIILEQMKKRNMHPSEGLVKALKYWKSNGLRIGLCSSSNRYYVDRVLSFFELTQYFDVSVGGDEVNVKKPAPDGYLKVLKIAGVPAPFAVAIEDSTSGIQAAQSAGIYCIGYDNPTSENQDLSRAEKTVCSLRELTELIPF